MDLGQNKANPDLPRILIVAEHASARFGGEAILPLHYFRILSRRGYDVRMIVHARTRDELLSLLPEFQDRIHFLPDTRFNKLMARVSRFLPHMLSSFTFGYVSRLSSQLRARRLGRRLVAEHRIDIIHQPIPVSPREPSVLYNMGAPVVIGPMNGNMTYPEGFSQKGQRRFVQKAMAMGRRMSRVFHTLSPGKLRAAALLVANDRTRRGLPSGVQGEVITLVENGVDLSLWSPVERDVPEPGPARFLFLGRLVEMKAVDVLLEGFARMTVPARLELVGDGALRPALEAQVDRLGLRDRVEFAGWQTQAECARRLREADVLVLPSIHECGGAVVLEAMACRVPVIATAWGGPMDYLDESCGILVPPISREALADGFRDAMTRLAMDPNLRATLGAAGRERILRDFDWESKIDRMVDIYRQFIPRLASAGSSLPESQARAEVAH